MKNICFPGSKGLFKKVIKRVGIKRKGFFSSHILAGDEGMGGALSDPSVFILSSYAHLIFIIIFLYYLYFMSKLVMCAKEKYHLPIKYEVI